MLFLQRGGDHMETYTAIIKESVLFNHMDAADVGPFLESMGARKRKFTKGSFVFYAGDDIKTIGFVVKGIVHIVQEDYWGNRNILARIQAGNLFGEAFAALPDAQSEVDVIVTEDAEIIFVDVTKILHGGVVLTPQQGQFVSNLLALMAQKNLILTRKIRYISQRSTRQKLMAYLSDEARSRRSATFRIDFNRQQLADFLSVDRSAMSSELSRMKAEGLIDYKKEKFTLKEI